MALDEDIGARLFEIRAACGRGQRDPETLEEFAARVERVTGVAYNPVTLSTLERGKRRWLVRDVMTFALVDPLRRGRVWLACFDDEQAFVAGTDAHRPPPKVEPEVRVERRNQKAGND